MRFKINENNEITDYATIGGLPGSIEFNGLLPEDFESSFKPSFYLYEDKLVKINPQYVEPGLDTPADTPSQVNKAIAQLTLQSAQYKTDQDKFNAQLLLQIAQMKEEK